MTTVIKEDRGDAPADVQTEYSLSLGDVFQGNLAADEDHDWIRLNLSAGVTCDITFSGIDAAFLALYDASGEEIIPAHYSYQEGTSLIYQPTASGVYFVGISAANDIGDYQVALAENTLPEGTYDEIAHYLTDGYGNWSGEGRHAFPVTPGGTLSANITGLTEAGRQLARWALESWTNVTGIQFEFVDDGNADIVFDDELAGGHASTAISNGVILSSEINVSKEITHADTATGGSAFSIYIHEIGHALGLGHAGPYNGFGSYGLDNVFLNDSYQATVMSYFSQGENTFVDASSANAVTPMGADIIAVHDLYGVPESINTGDTVYGYRSNVDGYLGEFFQRWTAETRAASGESATLTLYDNDGNDTLDLRTDVEGQRVSLRPEGISDVYGLTGNLVIARDSWIENFIAGSGNDVIAGNAVANDLDGRDGADSIWGGGGDDILEGGAGADRLDGDAGMDWAAYRASDAAVTINLAQGIVQGGHAEGDVLTGIENIIGSAHDDVLVGNDETNRLAGGAGADRLDGGAGEDWLSYRWSDARVTVNLGAGTFTGGHAEGDVVANFENISGSAYADVLTGDNGPNQLDGGQGDDVLAGGAGADRLVGGSGEDIASYEHSRTAVTVRLHALTALRGDAEGDSFGSLLNVSYSGRDGRIQTEIVPDIEHLRGSAHDDILAGDSRDNRLYGGSGADRLYGGPGGGDDVLSGGSGNDTLYGGLGDDVLEGGPDADTLRGGTGADTAAYLRSNAGVEVHLADGIARGGHAEGDGIFEVENITGSDHADVLSGDAGSNRLEGGVGPDRLDGGAGADWLVYLRSDTGVTVDLHNNTAAGGHAEGDVISGFEHIAGSAHPDILMGDHRANELAGNEGADELHGNGGDDVLAGGDGADRLYGGTGMDTLSYRLSSIGVRVSLAETTAGGGHAEGDVFSSIENIVGSGQRDILTGDAGPNRLDGLEGDDELRGGEGADRLIGNNGDDELYGAAGEDELRGDAGDDRLFGGSGGDILYGAEGDDELHGGADGDQLFGGTGADSLYGNAGDDDLQGGEGADRLHGHAGADRLVGGAGIDWASYFGSNAGVIVDLAAGTAERGHAGGDTLSAIENLTGSDYGDVLRGDALANVLYGLDGADELYGGDGDDVLQGGAGADYLEGGRGNDTALYQDSDAGVSVDLRHDYTSDGHAQGDTLVDIENITGSDHNDDLEGDAHANRLRGGKGDDHLHGGAGADWLDGGEGIDTIYYWESDAGVTVNLLEGSARGGHAEGDVITGVETVSGSDYGDVLMGDNKDNTFYGYTGDDEIRGNDGDDRLSGGAGADLLDGGAGLDIVDYWGSDAGVTLNLKEATVAGGHAQGDILIDIEGIAGSEYADVLYGDEHANTLQGDAGDDELYGDNGDDLLLGGEGSDSIYGNEGHDYIIGEAGDDDLRGDEGNDFLTGHAGDDNIHGGKGHDELYGDEGDDDLNGGAGDDFLAGSADADRLTGGAGDDELYGDGTDIEGSADVFIFAAGHGDDIIHDFADNEDNIDLSAFGLSGFDDLSLASDEQGTTIDLSAHDGGTILLAGFDITNLDATDFLF